MSCTIAIAHAFTFKDIPATIDKELGSMIRNELERYRWVCHALVKHFASCVTIHIYK